MPEAVWFESGHHIEFIDLRIVARLCFGGWNVADGFEQAAVVEPVDPLEGGDLDGFEAAPRAASMDHLGLVEAVDGLGERVVERRPPRLNLDVYPYLPRARVAMTSAKSYMSLLSGLGA